MPPGKCTLSHIHSLSLSLSFSHSLSLSLSLSLFVSCYISHSHTHTLSIDRSIDIPVKFRYINSVSQDIVYSSGIETKGINASQRVNKLYAYSSPMCNATSTFNLKKKITTNPIFRHVNGNTCTSLFGLRPHFICPKYLSLLCIVSC